MTQRTAVIERLRRGDTDLALAESLFQRLRSRIVSGVWRYGEKLPGTRVIARDCGVSRWTALMAIDMLAAEGLVTALGRSGTYVAWRGKTKDAEQAAHTDASPGNRPFARAIPALDLFPMHLWRRMQSRVWRSMPRETLEYRRHETGWPALREAIASQVATMRDIECAAEQVIIVPNLETGVRLTARALCQPESFAWIEHPGTHILRAWLESSSLVPVPVAVDGEGLDVADGLHLAPSAPFAVVSPAVCVPTCVRMSEARRQRLLAWASAAGSWILEIDDNTEFPLFPRRARSLCAQDGARRVVYFDTFSKLLFPSLRLAYLVVPRAVVPRFLEARWNFDTPAALPDQLVLTEFIVSGQLAKHVRRCRDAYLERRATMISALRDECGDMLAVDPDQYGLAICARMEPGADDALAAQLAAEAGIAVESLSEFAVDGDDKGLLLGYSGFRPEALREGVKKLAVVLRQL
jgi:GntR family transcriptional regulator/MocR family aminotransferase